MKPKAFLIGDVIENTDAFGTVKVIDVFLSPTSDNVCYHVKNEGDQVDFLTFAGELVSGSWSSTDFLPTDTRQP
jgi:hypothetical protein